MSLSLSLFRQGCGQRLPSARAHQVPPYVTGRKVGLGAHSLSFLRACLLAGGMGQYPLARRPTPSRSASVRLSGPFRDEDRPVPPDVLLTKPEEHTMNDLAGIARVVQASSDTATGELAFQTNSSELSLGNKSRKPGNTTVILPAASPSLVGSSTPPVRQRHVYPHLTSLFAWHRTEPHTAPPGPSHTIPETFEQRLPVLEAY